MECQIIALSKKPIEITVLKPASTSQTFIAPLVMHENVRVKSFETLCDASADAAKPDNANRLLIQISTERDRPRSALQAFVTFAKAPAQRQHKSNCQIRHSRIVAASRDGSDAPELSNRVCVNALVTDSSSRNDLKVGQGG